MQEEKKHSKKNTKKKSSMIIPKKRLNHLINQEKNDLPDFYERVHSSEQEKTQPTQKISVASSEPLAQKSSENQEKTQPTQSLKIDKDNDIPQFSEKNKLKKTSPETYVEEDFPAPPSLGEIKFARPGIDQNGMPLPEKETTNRRKKSSQKDVKKKKGNYSSCVIRTVFIMTAGLIFVSFAAISFAIYMYYDVAVSLPPVADLQTRALQFETTRIMDRNGNLLYEINDPTGGSRIYVPIEDISPNVIAATIATEDEGFYNHPGFSIKAIARAFFQNTKSGAIISGASTITQQLAEHLFLSQDEATSLSYLVKVREALLAQEMTRQYTKDEILEIYLNEIYYGNMAYGIEAASQTYFGIKAKDLSMAQATFLSGLPQAPSYYDVYTNRDAVLIRHQSVVYATRKLSSETNCIKIYESQIPVCVSDDDAVQMSYEIANYDFKPPIHEILYPHWVNYIRNQLENVFGSQAIFQSGFTVYTTLEPSLQQIAEETIASQVASLAENNVQSGALVAIQPSTGEILAMVGSADYYNDDIDGQVNMAINPRQPGSTIKPFTYAAAFELGWTPSTLLWDIETTFPASEDPYDSSTYTPRNYDYAFHGPVTLRTALASSYNIPAVSTLEFVGIYDNPSTPRTEGILNYYNRFAISGLNSGQYGYSLALGAAEISLVEMTSAYSVFANYGRYIPPVSITKVTNYAGEILYQYSPPVGNQVIDPNYAFLISDILSDNTARSAGFGSYSILNLDFDVAVKTGTTNDYRDNWTIGYTPDLVTGVWIGNADNSELYNTSGVYGAGPAWASFMTNAVMRISGGNPTPFYIPNEIIQEEICAISGTKPSDGCPTTRMEYFAANQPPLGKEHDLIQTIIVDTWTNTLVSTECPGNSEFSTFLNISNPHYKNWVIHTEQGRNWVESLGMDKDKIQFMPSETCKASMPKPVMEFAYPRAGQVIEGQDVRIFIVANATADFAEFHLQWAKGHTTDPKDFKTLYSSSTPIYEPTEIYVWDISNKNAQTITLRLLLKSSKGNYAETFSTFEILPIKPPKPTPIPSPTIVPTTPGDVQQLETHTPEPNE